MYKILSFYYFTFILVGFISAYFYGRHTKSFRWNEYLAILLLPFVGLIFMIYKLGKKPLWVFLTGLLIGPVMEWLLGFFYHKTMGSRLWIYERYPLLGRYTSWLVVPIWGFVLLFFWLVLKNF